MSYRISGSLLHRHREYCRIESEGSCSIESERGVFNLEHKDACVLALQLKLAPQQASLPFKQISL